MAKTPAWLNWVALVIGVLYLLADLGVFVWWTVNWWTAAFVLWGLWKVSS
jgi:hypothetical protein